MSGSENDLPRESSPFEVQEVHLGLEIGSNCIEYSLSLAEATGSFRAATESGRFDATTRPRFSAAAHDLLAIAEHIECRRRLSNYRIGNVVMVANVPDDTAEVLTERLKEALRKNLHTDGRSQTMYAISSAEALAYYAFENIPQRAIDLKRPDLTWSLLDFGPEFMVGAWLPHWDNVLMGLKTVSRGLVDLDTRRMTLLEEPRQFVAVKGNIPQDVMVEMQPYMDEAGYPHSLFVTRAGVEDIEGLDDLCEALRRTLPGLKTHFTAGFGQDELVSQSVHAIAKGAAYHGRGGTIATSQDEMSSGTEASSLPADSQESGPSAQEPAMSQISWATSVHEQSGFLVHVDEPELPALLRPIGGSDTSVSVEIPDSDESVFPSSLASEAGDQSFQSHLTRDTSFQDSISLSTIQEDALTALQPVSGNKRRRSSDEDEPPAKCSRRQRPLPR